MGVSDKTLKALGRDTVDEMDTMREEDLKLVITDAAAAMKQAKQELEANSEYQKAKADVSLLSSGKREVDKRQKAKTGYALDRLEELGKLDSIARFDWEKLRVTALKELTARRERRAQDEAAQASGKVRRFDSMGNLIQEPDESDEDFEQPKAVECNHCGTAMEDKGAEKQWCSSECLNADNQETKEESESDHE